MPQIIHRLPHAGTAWLIGLLLSGCVTVYEPLVSLQRPVVIDPEVGNFEGQHLLVRCIPGDYLRGRFQSRLRAAH